MDEIHLGVFSKRIKRLRVTKQLKVKKQLHEKKIDSNIVGKYTSSILYSQNNPGDELFCSGGLSQWIWLSSPNVKQLEL